MTQQPVSELEVTLFGLRRGGEWGPQTYLGRSVDLGCGVLIWSLLGMGAPGATFSLYRSKLSFLGYSFIAGFLRCFRCFYHARLIHLLSLLSLDNEKWV